MIECIISGGQTGVDQSGWRAAKYCGIPTRGWMPKGWLTEDGMKPEFKKLYNAQEHESSLYPPRTVKNVISSDATIWIGKNDSAGYGCTIKACKLWNKPYAVVGSNWEPTARDIYLWINAYDYKIINIAGNRESKSPGIGMIAVAYLIEVFTLVNGIE